MLTNDFYDIIDKQIDEIVTKYSKIKLLEQQKKNKFGRKSVAFLLWFLENYAPKLKEPEKYIVEGNDDTSCDIIYNYLDENENEIIYVVQAKWFKKSKIHTTNSISKEIKACLSDFDLILFGRKKTSVVNSDFNRMYKILLEQKKRNKRIEFIFLSLCQNSSNADGNIEKFETSLCKFKKMHIERLKKDFIDLNYKNMNKVLTLNDIKKPLGMIKLEVVPNKYILKESPYKSYIFLVKPQWIHDIYEEFGDSLFCDNIRNPLASSHFNKEIIKTLNEEPSFFWAFNNGITAITNEINSFYPDNNTIDIKGLQIINGAQTVNAIHQAYSKMSEKKKQTINNDAHITFRLLKSGENDYDSKVTKFTNSQNPMINRDFHSNDLIQEHLQDDFFANTNIWYERRRGEFIARKIPRNIIKISNEIFAKTYLAYYLQEPLLAKNATMKFFVSEKIDKTSGLYEKIFHDKYNYKNLQASFYTYKFVEEKLKEFKRNYKNVRGKDENDLIAKDHILISKSFILHSTTHITALIGYKLSLKHSGFKKTSGVIISQELSGKRDELDLAYKIIVEAIVPFIEKKRKNKSYSDSKYFKSGECFNELKLLVK